MVPEIPFVILSLRKDDCSSHRAEDAFCKVVAEEAHQRHNVDNILFNSVAEDAFSSDGASWSCSVLPVSILQCVKLYQNILMNHKPNITTPRNDALSLDSLISRQSVVP